MCRVSWKLGTLTSWTSLGHIGLWRVYFTFICGWKSVRPDGCSTPRLAGDQAAPTATTQCHLYTAITRSVYKHNRHALFVGMRPAVITSAWCNIGFFRDGMKASQTDFTFTWPPFAYGATLVARRIQVVLSQYVGSHKWYVSEYLKHEIWILCNFELASGPQIDTN